MCLTTKQIEPKVATEDITCYKVLNLSNDGVYSTPYINTIVSSKIIEGEKTLKPELEEGETFFDKSLQIDGRCIHSYATEKESLYQQGINKEIFECVIPKGALYYEGDSNDYASSEIRFVKKIAERKKLKRKLTLKDIGSLDWNLDKDNIINAFSVYGFLYDDKCIEKVNLVPVNVDVEPCEDEPYEDEDGEIVVYEEVSEEEKTQMEELKKKNEALSYRLYLAIKYMEENELDGGDVILPIVRRIFNQNPEVIIDIKQVLDLYNFYFDIIKPLQWTCGIDIEASTCAIVAEKLIGKETAMVDYVKGVIETCNTVLSKITE